LTDEISELKIEALSLWDEAGKVYLQENENDLKDQLDFLIDEPDHYPPFGMFHRSVRHTARKNELNHSYNVSLIIELSYFSEAVIF
jgi:hypothetical protein